MPEPSTSAAIGTVLWWPSTRVQQHVEALTTDRDVTQDASKRRSVDHDGGSYGRAREVGARLAFGDQKGDGSSRGIAAKVAHSRIIRHWRRDRIAHCASYRFSERPF